MNYQKNIKFLIILISVLYTPYSFSVDRIENFNINRKKVNKVYLSFSKASLIRFPSPIEEIRIGLPKYYEGNVSKTYSRELTLFIKEDTKKPSNLIVRTSDEKLYVFDLVPSNINHQDIVFVDDSFYNLTKKNRKSTKTNNKRITLLQESKPIKVEMNRSTKK